MTKAKNIRWFIQPGNKYTNGALSEALKNNQGDSEEVRDNQDNSFLAWEIPSLGFAKILKTDPECKFNLWKKEGPGKVYLVNFLLK